MPRASRKQAQAHRDEIAAAAARLFRERGIDGVSVAETMAAAGLTHGGFYNHFPSKDALAAEACARSFARSTEAWAATAAAAASPAAALAAIVAEYLRPGPEGICAPSCAAAALATDVGRAAPDKPVRAAYAEGLEALVAELEKLLPRGDALALLAGMIGAVSLARATRGTPLAEEILAAARTRFGGQAKGPSADPIHSDGPSLKTPSGS